MGGRVTVYLSQGSALSQVNYDPQNSLSGGEKNPQSSRRRLDLVSSSPGSHELTILAWDNIIPQQTRGRNVCLTVRSGDSAEARKELRERRGKRSRLHLKRRTDLVQWGRSEREICSTKEKSLFRGVQRRNSSTDGDVSDAPAWKCLWLSAGGKLKRFCFKWWIKGFYM